MFSIEIQVLFTNIFVIVVFDSKLYIIFWKNREFFLLKFCLNFDFIKLLGTGHEIFYLDYILVMLFSILLLLFLNQSNSLHYKWFEMIEVLNE